MKGSGALLGAAAIFAAASIGQAQDITLKRGSSAAGGSSSGGGYTLVGAVDPTASGSLHGEGYTLTAGFLTGVVALQNLVGPMLNVSPAGASITMTWTTSESGWTLESTSSLVLPWASATESIAQNGDMRTVTIAAPTGIRFYRLRKIVGD